ncbi:AAA family ATPase, partial [Klebsiella pneumoniae]
MTDNQGRTIDFKNTIIIMTSDLGAQHLLEGIDKHGVVSEEAAQLVDKELRAHFRPEFLNRIDDIILFKPLTQDEVE